MLIPDIQWREQYTSAALNRKFAGIIEPGIYEGFTVSSVSGGPLKFSIDVDGGVAVVERDGYSITVRGSGSAEIVSALSTGTSYAVIEVFYDISQTTTATLKVVASPSSHHCVLAKFSVSNGVATLQTYNRDILIDCGAI